MIGRVCTELKLRRIFFSSRIESKREGGDGEKDFGWFDAKKSGVLPKKRVGTQNELAGLSLTDQRYKNDINTSLNSETLKQIKD